MATSTFLVGLQSDLGQQYLADITVDLLRDLHRTEGLAALPQTQEVGPGQRSDTLLSLGQLAVGIASTGALAAFIGILRAYVERDRTLRITLEHPELGKVGLEIVNLSPDQLEALISKLSSVDSFRKS